MFKNVIGQEQAKKLLSFRLETYGVTGIFPHCLFLGGTGNGKTHLVRALGKELSEIERSQGQGGRRLVSPSPTQVSSVSKLMDSVFLPNLSALSQPDNDRKLLFFFDECHTFPEKVTNEFLIILNSDRNGISSIEYEGGVLEFDFSKITFMFATTEAHKVFHALKDRLAEINVTDYTMEELKQIVLLNCEGVTIDDDVSELLEGYIRQNGRGATKMAKNIHDYCLTRGVKHINLEHWNSIVENFTLLPFGLELNEVRAIKFLRDGACSLKALATRLHLPVEAVKQQVELYPIRLGLMDISGLRHITQKGRFLLDEYRL